MSDDGIEAESFRHVAGHLASGVAVITCVDAGGEPHGMTVSAVTSLSLHPPMMLVCLNQAAPTTSVVDAAGRFCINILRQGQETVARQFATPSTDKFQGVSCRPGITGAPVLESVLAWLECEVEETISGGTHQVLLARVLRAEATSGKPLTYFRGAFGEFGSTEDSGAYATLREFLLGGQWASEWLDESRLARDLGLGVGATDYALSRLTGEGLIRRGPQGWRPIDFSEEASLRAIDAQEALGLGVVEFTRQRGVPERAVDDMAAAFRLVRASARPGADASVLAGQAARFVEAFVGTARNQHLTDVSRRLHLFTMAASAQRGRSFENTDFVRAHGQLLDALRAEDFDAAREAVRLHAELARDRVRTVMHDVTSGVHQPVATT